MHLLQQGIAAKAFMEHEVILARLSPRVVLTIVRPSRLGQNPVVARTNTVATLHFAIALNRTRQHAPQRVRLIVVLMAMPASILQTKRMRVAMIFVLGTP